jgi:vacuolar protein sorting-associated protein 72
MTQADRLVEAERTERKNSKSLNRWEETEKKRSEEQKARLAALHNRQLEGPVITWWSGLAKWVNGKLAHVGGRW